LKVLKLGLILPLDRLLILDWLAYKLVLVLIVALWVLMVLAEAVK
jgi:hypothetical protein